MTAQPSKITLEKARRDSPFANAERNWNWALGYEAAFQEFAPLLEAAREYRDAREAIVDFAGAHPGVTGEEWAKLFNEVDRATARLQIAARTFEAGHVEEGEE